MSTQTSENFPIDESIIQNPWRNVYWFARMLINGDKYGGIGKDSKLLASLCTQLNHITQSKQDSEAPTVALCKEAIRTILTQKLKRAKSRELRIKLFCDDLDKKLDTLEDVAVFIATAEHVMIPINEALQSIPNDDRAFTEATAKALLDRLGDKGLATVVGMWDDLGVEGCLTAERDAVIKTFTQLRTFADRIEPFASNIVLTAFAQEFERRLGQKRKGRAGGSLEDVASFLFNYYGIKATHEPDHFQADIEVDKWVKCNDGWLIGISCKRTLRERWKQVTAADRGVLSKFKIKQIWHLVTYDEDLSDEKLALMGGQSHIFYLADSSRRLEYAANHIGLKDYVKPMSSFVNNLRSAIG